jgi:prepilin-type N-terminal cleavage/methylation domain-containing protein
MPEKNKQHPRAFTIVELLVSILVIGTLMAILIVGARAAISYTRNAADRQAAIAMRVGVIQFKTENGFFPPLTRDQYPAAGTDRARVDDIPNQPLGFKRISVYDLNVDRFKRVLMRSVGSGDTPADGAAWGALTDYPRLVTTFQSDGIIEKTPISASQEVGHLGRSTTKQSTREGSCTQIGMLANATNSSPDAPQPEC